MSSLLFSTKWRWLHMSGSKKHIILLMVVIVFISSIQFCCGDIEPKPNYEELSTAMAKLNDNNMKIHNDDNNILDDDSAAVAANDHIAPNDGNKGAENDGGLAPKSDEKEKSSLPLGELGFIHAFVASLSVILVSELGDKTFFIAAIMAMRHPRITVFTGAIAALALMTILSAVFGMAAQIIPRIYTYYISTFLFAVFGLKMLKEGYYMKASDAQEELEEVQSDLRKREDELMKSLKDGASSERTSGNDRNAATRGSSTSLRRIKEQYNSDEDEEQTRAMLPGSIKNSSPDGNGIASSVHRSSISTDNNNSNITTQNGGHYPLTNSIQDGAGNNGAATILNHHTSGSTQSLTSITKLNKTEMNGNGKMMELKQFGSKKSLEKEASATSIQDPESGVIRRAKPRGAAYLTSRVLMQAFTMTFLAEWGDRSQLTTIILSAREDVYGVIVGGVLGHSVCTGLAVIGGRMIAQRISVRTVTLVGGVVFILFAISSLFFNPDD